MNVLWEGDAFSVDTRIDEDISHPQWKLNLALCLNLLRPNRMSSYIHDGTMVVSRDVQLTSRSLPPSRCPMSGMSTLKVH